jgi:hypothetical protein
VHDGCLSNTSLPEEPHSFEDESHHLSRSALSESARLNILPFNALQRIAGVAGIGSARKDDSNLPLIEG